MPNFTEKFQNILTTYFESDDDKQDCQTLEAEFENLLQEIQLFHPTNIPLF